MLVNRGQGSKDPEKGEAAGPPLGITEKSSQAYRELLHGAQGLCAQPRQVLLRELAGPDPDILGREQKDFALEQLFRIGATSPPDPTHFPQFLQEPQGAPAYAQVELACLS